MYNNNMDARMCDASFHFVHIDKGTSNQYVNGIEPLLQYIGIPLVVNKKSLMQRQTYEYVNHRFIRQDKCSPNHRI